MKLFSKIIRYALGGAVATLASAAFAQDMQDVDMALAGKSMIASIPLFVEEMGFYEDHGINIRFITMESATASSTALISGSVPFADTSIAALITAQARGQDVIGIHAGYRGVGGSLVLTNAVAEKLGVDHSAPVQERLKALDGLTIATPSPTSTYTVSYRGATEAAGANVNFTYMAIPTMPAALASGAVDGYVASAPFWLVPVVDGSGLVWLSGPGGEVPAEFRPSNTAVTITRRDYAEANPEIVEAMIAAHDDFAAATTERPDDVKAAVLSIFPNLDAATLDQLYEVESAAWRTEPLSADSMAHDIHYIQEAKPDLAESLKGVDPGSMIYR